LKTVQKAFLQDLTDPLYTNHPYALEKASERGVNPELYSWYRINTNITEAGTCSYSGRGNQSKDRLGENSFRGNEAQLRVYSDGDNKTHLGKIGLI
jgi:hypothetical protein|tara:strand:+ start:2651 stop:2938 length:288 start_codon:yes stop_codon:yes gene_type:complete